MATRLAAAEKEKQAVLEQVKALNADKQSLTIRLAAAEKTQQAALDQVKVLWSSFFGHADQMVGLCTGGQLGGRAGQRFVLCG
ncbi:hypothetical protein ABNU19_22200 [Klebsiella pneumoniae]